MTVKELLAEIKRCQKKYGKEFLDWEVYTEQISNSDKKYKKTKQNWHWLTDGEGWEYFRCAGFWTKWKAKKIFTINVNY